MAYLFGYQNPTVSGERNTAGPDSIISYVFTAPEDCVVSAFNIVTAGAIPVAIYVFDPNNGDALLAQSAPQTTTADVPTTFTLTSPLALTAGQDVRIGLHSDTYLRTAFGAAIEFLSYDNHPYSSGPPANFSSSGTAQGYEIVLWADGTVGAPTPAPGIPADTLQFEGAVQANLTNLYVQIVTGTTGTGTQLYESSTVTTDANGVRAPIDLSATTAVVGDPIRVTTRTADGRAFEHVTTVGDIS